MSTESAAEIAVRRSVSVPLDPARAFALFTTRISEFWGEHSIGESPMAAVVIEPRAGGRWFERGTDGTETPWGRVAVWEPPGRLVLVWQIGFDWAYDPALETEVEIDFEEQGPGRTRLVLVHRHVERYGEHTASMRALFESPDAWAATLDRYAALAG
ncbi:uncharacterized protein YndB with AHSA1/START domain [Murinocardiopsis flavida]|uniref:Uncharacterized protein YndB with AHSA1/START domain n=1 Tax=Murinocardiopsis flavida TaxID=645275 RepID=A0A2P8DP03_9ACTN|nr:SRPBCC family protein [Murinocardiopsis flavida]PSK98919.1 uncharacterized protein YndB with AHSA1/START domain [Murinocardiopsis flavida]